MPSLWLNSSKCEYFTTDMTKNNNVYDSNTDPKIIICLELLLSENLEDKYPRVHVPQITEDYFAGRWNSDNIQCFTNRNAVDMLKHININNKVNFVNITEQLHRLSGQTITGRIFKKFKTHKTRD